MTRGKGLDDRFLSRLGKRLEQLEARRKALAPMVVATWIGLPIVTAGLLVRSFQGEGAATVAGLGVVLGGVGAWWAGRRLRAAWVRDYKAAAIARMVAQLGHDLEYRQKGHLAKESFERSGLFPGRVSRFKGEDLVWGAIGGHDAGFCELHVTQDGSRFKETSGRVVRLLFLEATVPERSRCTVLLIPAKTDLAWFEKAKSLTDGMAEVPPPCALGDPLFAAVYKVRAIHEPSAERLLTPALKERLVAIAERSGHRAMVSFDRDKLYVAVPLGRLDDAFEPTLFKPLTDAAALTSHLETLRLMAGMVEAVAPAGAETA
jgi:hypothetical protein